jgi:tetratricopeptide (TPR) repeat protein
MLVNAADLAGKTGDGAGERAMLEQAMATFESVAPVTHRSALTCREHLLTACVRDAQWPRAAELAEKLVEIREQSGEIAADAGRFALYELALCREAQGRPDDAIALAERAAIDSSAGAEPSRRDWAALARCRRIAWLAERGDIDRARDELERMRSSQPSSDPSTSVGAWATLAEASVEAALGETSAAVARLEPLAALDITARDARLAPMLARAQLALLLAGSDPQRSNELSSRARTELERALGPTHPRVVAFGR